MVTLKEFNLNNKKEWDTYFQLFKEYILEVCSDDDLEETISDISGEDYHKQILKVCNRNNNKFHVCRILKDNTCLGFCDYICYLDENGKCLIGNFYLHPEYRNKGYGTDTYLLMEIELIKLGGKYIDITPATKAISFYLRKGFNKTDDISQENGETIYRKILMSE